MRELPLRLFGRFRPRAAVGLLAAVVALLLAGAPTLAGPRAAAPVEEQPAPAEDADEAPPDAAPGSRRAAPAPAVPVAAGVLLPSPFRPSSLSVRTSMPAVPVGTGPGIRLRC